MEKSKIVTCVAPVNIALVKYWGKADEDLIIPINDSLSLTLSTKDLCATTSIVASADFKEDKFWLNGKEESTETKRIRNCLTAFRQAASKQSSSVDPAWHLRICSKNNFPTAAGLASSAAGFACLVSALQELYGLQGNFSSIARQGSGSACRSMFGGFVQWEKGANPDGSDSIATQLHPESYWPEIRILICVVEDAKKDTGSTDGMRRSVQTSELLEHRAKVIVPRRMEQMRGALQRKDFSALAALTMKDSNQFHATCQDTYPPIRYMTQTSWDIVSLVHKYNDTKGSNKLAYTFDAGPNAFLFCLDEDAPEILEMLVKNFPPVGDDFIRGVYAGKLSVNSKTVQAQNHALKYIITTEAGSGPSSIVDHLFTPEFNPIS